VDALTIGLVLGFATCAIADWLAVWHGAEHRRTLTKPAATIALVAIAAVAREMAGDARVALVVAALLCLAGDVALLGHSDERFLAGLSAFALGHIAYVVTAFLVGVSWPRLAVAFPVVVVLLGFQVVTRMFDGALRRGGPPMLGAVAVYSLIISAMVVTATGTPSWLAFAGATWFAISDSMIAYNRFVRPFHRADLAIMVTYHVGQGAVGRRRARRPLAAGALGPPASPG
jgi:uncharacterized membrane protein YhhN